MQTQSETTERDLIAEVEALLAKTAPDGKIRDGASAYLFDMRGPDLLRRLVAEVRRLRERFSVTCNNCGERYLGPKDESLHGYNVCNMSRCED